MEWLGVVVIIAGGILLLGLGESEADSWDKS